METELYPDRLNDSLYVQSVRSHPEIHNEATVLVNYKEGRNRELIRVKFNESGLSDRVFSTFRSSYGNSDTYSVPSGLTTELTALTSVDMESSYMDSGCDVAADVEVSMSGMNCMEDLELFEFDKPLATYPSNLLYSDMNQLCNTSIALCKSITHTKNTDVIASDVSGSVALNSNELNHLCLDDGDMLSLFCSEDESEVQDGREENIERVVHSYPVHLFILQHRCPTLWKYWEGLECENSNSGSCNRALCINKAVVLHLLSNRNSDEKSKNFNHDCNNDVKSMHKVFNEFQHVDQYCVAIRIFVQYLYTGVLCQVPFKRHLNHNGSPTSSSRLSRKAQCILILWDVLFLGTHTNLPDLCSLVDIALSR